MPAIRTHLRSSRLILPAKVAPRSALYSTLYSNNSLIGMHRTSSQSFSMSSILPATANASLVQVTRPPLFERPSTTPLLQYVHSKALYKAVEIVAYHAGPRSTIDMRLYHSDNQKALILHAARLSQSMHNVSARARLKFALASSHANHHPKPAPKPPKYRHPDANPMDILLGKTVYFSRSRTDGHIIAKNGSGSVVFPPSGSGTVVVTQRMITPGVGRGKDGRKSAVVLKDAQGNVIKRIRKNPTLCFD